MSMNAYNSKIIHKSRPSFSLSNENTYLMLEEKLQISMTRAYIFDVPLDVLREIAENVDDDEKESILEDIAEAERNGNDTVLYDCF